VKCISLLTDFGIRDGNVGVMKGVIWSIAPETQIADLSHTGEAQNILAGSIVLGRSVPYFPEGSVHVAVVDPGVGTARRPIAAKLGSRYFVGPDNGLLTILLDQAEKDNQPVQIVHLNQPKYWLPVISHVFHGRDIFAPVAAHIVNGVPLTELGTEISDPVRKYIPKPEKTPHGWKGEIIYIDHFGNLASNIRIENLEGVKDLDVKLCGETVTGLVKTFGEKKPGELVNLYGSTGDLIVSVVNGNAASLLNAHSGDKFEVIVKE
jgi:S-adenosylmethionine hydrolase